MRTEPPALSRDASARSQLPTRRSPELQDASARAVPRGDALDDLCVRPDASLREAIESIGRNSQGIVLVTDAELRLLATVTDGDLRRGILAGMTLDDSMARLLADRASALPPLTGSPDLSSEDMLRSMRIHQVRHLPLLDEQRRVLGLVTVEDLVSEPVPPLRALIMAGGLGMRLRPLTESVPKPMLPVGERPLMERMIGRLHDAGIRKVQISTHYLSERIIDHFGDGGTFGVELSYVREGEPLGTAGALGLIEDCNEPILVINGDILTEVDFRAMARYHQEHNAAMTIAVRKYAMKVPYGVVQTVGSTVSSLIEKPTYNVFLNAGIYLLEPSIREFLPHGSRFDMPELIGELIRQEIAVVSFPVLEYWIDIGEPADYQQVRIDVKEGRFSA